MPGNSIVIVGAGYISVEFASIFRGFGAEVHLMYRKALPLTGCAAQAVTASPLSYLSAPSQL